MAWTGIPGAARKTKTQPQRSESEVHCKSMPMSKREAKAAKKAAQMSNGAKRKVNKQPKKAMGKAEVPTRLAQMSQSARKMSMPLTI